MEALADEVHNKQGEYTFDNIVHFTQPSLGYSSESSPHKQAEQSLLATYVGMVVV